MTKNQHNDLYLLEKINLLEDSKGVADVETFIFSQDFPN